MSSQIVNERVLVAPVVLAGVPAVATRTVTGVVDVAAHGRDLAGIAAAELDGG